jgi:hypothetical protein
VRKYIPSYRWVVKRLEHRQLHRQLFGHRQESAPGITSVILNSFSIFQDRIARARLMGDPPDLLIVPDLGKIGVLDFHRADEMVASGAAAVRPHLATIERYVSSSSKQPKATRLFADDHQARRKRFGVFARATRTPSAKHSAASLMASPPRPLSPSHAVPLIRCRRSWRCHCSCLIIE